MVDHMLSILHGLFLCITILRMGWSYRVVCYYENWSQYRDVVKGQRITPMTPEKIDPYMCTHINYAFAAVDSITHTIKQTEWNDEDSYHKIMNMKKINPELNILLSVGGYQHGTKPFVAMASSPETRRSFIKHSLTYLRKYGFDGIDIDWETPGSEENPIQEKRMFTNLIKELRDAYEVEYRDTNTSTGRLLISIAVSPHKHAIDNGYHPSMLGKSIDYMNLMTYDFHGNWTNTLGHNAPLCGTDDEKTTVTSAARYWSSKGMPADKIVVGIPAYGTSWALRTESKHIGQDAIWFSTLPYYQICNEGQRFYDQDQCAYYKVKKELWISYDDPQTLLSKCKLIKSEKYGGAMIWSLSMDDYNGDICNSGTFPLHHAISTCILGNRRTPMKRVEKIVQHKILDQDSTSKNRCTHTDSCEQNILIFVVIFATTTLYSLVCTTRVKTWMRCLRLRVGSVF